ncbi:MAG TPA: M20/M25/M40 family metallo-hydrolase [Candidatus Limnocylindrales bacterium]|nr:M20/M25/M40 family metallo-hydrolase [Candidatus Limnocylindrales bacterium]
MPHRSMDTSRITALLEAMVRIESINPDLAPGGSGEGELAAWLGVQLNALGFDVTFEDVAPGRPNLIARRSGRGHGAPLMFCGHLDTVGVTDYDGNPLDPRIQDGKLYGRGSYDMKGGLAAVLGAVAAVPDTPGDLWLGLVIDEEYASIGADALAGSTPPMATVLVEPTDLRACIAHKGFAWLTVTTEGQAAHGSLTAQGIDAIAHMGRLLGEMESWAEGVFAAQPDPLVGPASAHASLIDGGLGWSTFPDRCSLKVEHRLLPDQTADDALALWQDAIARQSAADPRFMARTVLDLYRPGYRIAEDAPVTQALQQAVTTVTGAPASICGIPAWMDSAVLAAAGFATIIYGPGGTGAHAATEYVDLESVFTCARVYAAMIQAWR